MTPVKYNVYIDAYRGRQKRQRQLLLDQAWLQMSLYCAANSKKGMPNYEKFMKSIFAPETPEEKLEEMRSLLKVMKKTEIITDANEARKSLAR